MSSTEDIINDPKASDEEKAKAYYALKKYNEAIENFNKVIKRKPDVGAYSYRGHAYYALKKYNEAIKDFDKAIELNPNYATAYYHRAFSHGIVGKYKEAIEDCENMIRLEYTPETAYYLMGLSYSQLGKYEEAIKDYNKVIELKPDDAGAYYSRGHVYLFLNKHDKAIKDYNKVIKLKPDDAEAYYSRGHVYLFLNKHDKGIKDLNKVIKLKPDDAGAYYSRGHAYYTLEKYDEAIDDFDKAIKRKPDIDIALWYLSTGIEYLNKKNYSKALDCFNASLHHGINHNVVAFYTKIKFTNKDDALAKSILTVFQNTMKILDDLKVQKNTEHEEKREDTMNYLSHTTRLSVLTRQLLPIENTQMPKGQLRKFRLHHIAYANDPTEGSFLFQKLGILQKETEHTGTMPYVMIASFCAGTSPEALDRLPIWSMYGDDAKGISLLFKTDDIASDETGHIGSLPAPAKEMMQEFSDTQKENATHTAMPEAKDEKDKKPPPQILYRVHYMGKDDKEKNNINTCIQAIKKHLKTIQKNDTSWHSKTLTLLDAVRYLIKDKSYAHEKEYRLLCLCTDQDIPDVLKCDENSEAREDDTSRVYVDTDIAEKLCAVMTGPRVRNAQRLAIQYRLHAYKTELSKLEDPAIRLSSIPYM